MILENNEYTIQGVKLTELANQYGTPLYVYDAEKIASQYHLIRDAFKNTKVRVKYACKALSNIHILKLLKDQGAELDCVSIEEVLIGMKAGFTAEQVLFTPN